MLPAPLAVSGQHSSSVSSSLADSAFLGPQPDAQPNYRLQRAPDDPSLYEYRDSETSRSERDPILMSPVGSDARSMTALGSDVVVRTAGGASYPGETQNPYRHSQHQVAAYDQAPHYGGYSAEVGDTNEPPMPAMPRSRGVSLVDPGVVSSPDAPVRRTRQSKRSSAIVPTSPVLSVATSRFKHQSLPPPPTSPTAASAHSSQSQQSTQTYLPPGAAPPKPQSRGYPQ